MGRHFDRVELACKHCGMVRFHPGVLEELEALRVEFDHPMVLRSACRCKAHNDRPAAEGGAGGHTRSLHVCDFEQHEGQLGCLAFDVETLDGALRGRLFVIAWRRGWSIGWNAKKRFMHIDLRVLLGLPQTTFDY